MALEATLLERYQELLKWQVEQEERLLKQQQEQRDMLNFEQARKFEALGLSGQNIVLQNSLSTEGNDLLPMGESNAIDESYRMSEASLCKDHVEENSPKVSRAFQAMESPSRMALSVPPLQLTTNRYLNFRSPIEGFSPHKEIPADREILNERSPERLDNGNEHLAMDGVEPLDKPPRTFVLLDDLPVPSPKKDFKTLLEERLREETEDETNIDKNPKIQIKRPFLKKGEGLARFKPNANSDSSQRLGRRRSASLSANMRLTSTLAPKNSSTKLKETPRSSRAVSGYGKGIPPTTQAKLNLKQVALPKLKVCSKSVCTEPKSKPVATNKPRAKPPVDMNVSSDMETKTRRELEEMRIFELLEEKAENSSFCSNSSTVLALLRQSTPVKNRNSIVQTNRDKIQNGKLEISTKKHESSDSNLEEIVRTTKSNRIMPNSPVTKIRETVLQKDFVISQWDAASQKENIDSSISNRISNRAIAAGTYKSTKHTTIQLNNNNNNNNNGNQNYKNLIDSTGNDHSNLHKDEILHDSNDKRKTDNFQPEKESANVSLHVRFSEYNEYKTIDLTDTSVMSNDLNNSRDYRLDKPWNDRSTSPDSADIEVLFSKIGHSKVSKSSNYLGKGLTNTLQENAQNSCDGETTDQTTDNEDEDYTSTGSNEESYDEENKTVTELKEEKEAEAGTRFSSHDKKEESSDRESENCNDSGSTIGQENDEIRDTGIDSSPVNDTIFKSELLKTRLAELEREIEIFRKENAALVVQRKKLQDEERRLHKEYKIKEETLEKEKKANEEILHEEKKRLAREKAALENRLKDAREKSLLSKQERQETQILREQLDELREEINQKDSRWQAAQARQKSQIRVLQTENSRLKQDLEKLRATKSNNSRNRKPLASANTRSIHLISKHLDGKKNVNSRPDSSSDEEQAAPIIHRKPEAEEHPVEDEDLIPEAKVDGGKNIAANSVSRQSSLKDDEDLRKKRNLYANLLNEATEGLRGNEQIVLGKSDKTRQQSQNEGKPAETLKGDWSASRKWENSPKLNHDEPNKTGSAQTPENVVNSGEQIPYPRSPIEQKNRSSTDHRRWSDVPICQNDRIQNSGIKQQDIREVQCPDGHLEYWYPNGNVKKIFPDRNVIKMIYYNGDVRESLEDGSVKYFYASTRTWHTTLPDGSEILEFPE